MSFNRPTLAELVERITNDLSTRLIGSVTALRRAVIRVFGAVYGGAVHLLHGHLDWITKQIMPDTAEGEFLERWASIWGITRVPASFATRTLTITGVDATLIPQGTVWQDSDEVEFTVDDDVTISSGTATAALTAVVAGITGNAIEASSLSLVSPITGVDSSGTVAAGGVDAVDDELDESLLARLLLKIREAPQGGSLADYEQWALAVAGVTRVWPLANTPAAGQVTVRFVRDNDVSIIPDSDEIAAVVAYIADLQPATADVIVLAPTPDTLNFTMAINPDTAAIRLAITAELTDLLSREAEPGGTIYLSHIQEAISQATDEVDHVLASPSANVVSSTGHMPVMGSVTFT